MISKLALGTVQFGLKYGINNQDGIPDNDELTHILNTAHRLNISVLDTAEAYGDAEYRIGKLADNSFDVVSKFTTPIKAVDVERKLERSLAHLQRDCIYGYMSHHCGDLIKYPEIWDVLTSLKTDGRIKKIGYSLYEPSELFMLLDLKMVPDIVQIPYSLLDRKFETHLQLLEDIGVEVHVRSVFLQGLYHKDPSSLDKKFELLRPTLYKLHQICRTYEIEIGALALNFVLDNVLIKKVVIGVDNADQLLANCESIENWKNPEGLYAEVLAIDAPSKDLLNPRNW